MTNYQTFVKRQQSIGQKIQKNSENIKKWFLPSAVSVVLSLLGGGCNTAIQMSNGLGKDMQVAGAGIQAMTDKQKDIGSFSYVPQGQPDSMVLDHEVVRSLFPRGTK